MVAIAGDHGVLRQGREILRAAVKSHAEFIAVLDDFLCHLEHVRHCLDGLRRQAAQQAVERPRHVVEQGQIVLPQGAHAAQFHRAGGRAEMLGRIIAVRAGRLRVHDDGADGRLAQPIDQLRLGVVGHQVRHDGKRGVHGRPDGRV
ncbi:hypothetical protein D3C72_1551810 [compost metagenome]